MYFLDAFLPNPRLFLPLQRIPVCLVRARHLGCSRSRGTGSLWHPRHPRLAKSQAPIVVLTYNYLMDKTFRSGFVAVIGRPSVGKSTLMNTFLKQKVAAVSPKPQTTRRRQLGILTTDEAQVIFVDTPGIHKPVHKLGDYMNSIAEDSLQDADAILWLVAVDQPPAPEDQRIASILTNLRRKKPVILVLNKMDKPAIWLPASNFSSHCFRAPNRLPSLLAAG